LQAICLTGSTGMFLTWLLIVTRAWVKRGADNYATQLVAAIDTLPATPAN